MPNLESLDFSRRFWIGSGTSIYATLDTLDEVDGYLAAQDSLFRHFCKIYDHEKLQLTDGWQYRQRKHGHPVEWRPW